MERVSGDGFFSYRREVREDRKSRKSGAASGSRSFSSRMQSIHQSGEIQPRDPEKSDAEIAELMDAVFAAGDVLKRDIGKEAMEEYKRAVRTFVSVVVSRGFDVEERTSGATIAKRKRFALVNVIDEKLERLIAGLVSSQRSQLDVLARVDEINGLIVNLVQ